MQRLPRPQLAPPSAAQVAYGTGTVVLSTLAMLLLTQARSGAGVAAIGAVALALGVLVALTVRLPFAGRAASGTAGAADAPERAADAEKPTVPAPRGASAAAPRLSEGSLRP
jgi:nucleoid-associated protein YgaU